MTEHGTPCGCITCIYNRLHRIDGAAESLVPDDYTEFAEGDNGTVRQFATGATRDTAEGKPDYEGFLSPAVLIRFGEYMDANRKQSDGQLRDGDNWQKGMPVDDYVKSMFRHFMDVWALHRGVSCRSDDIEESLCALIFNAMGLLFEKLKEPKP